MLSTEKHPNIARILATPCFLAASDRRYLLIQLAAWRKGSITPRTYSVVAAQKHSCTRSVCDPSKHHMPLVLQ